ncbi:hypothetical protein BWI96_05090 [Siphonobacter sp. SORGH_AS_0500]|uniref:TlpA family protein disulfide reductase n=1 Tax=Siphonobacter sp. SORGH_AS_0500 TaxID=1864824 RepID=UPI000CB7117D|nr:TlpA disulfide reductase family protein [Siphonobacter sp. SORGH_AS_0500]PKK37837.1 hypothetical protein BWI96_05090 [Siphonobacter sp. SORGH_AS_0500]
MKNLITILFLLPFFTGIAQSPKPIAFEDPAFNQQFAKRSIPKVTGQLIHVSKEELQKLTIQYAISNLTGQKMKTARINADGRFTLELENPLPYQQVFIGIGDLFTTGIYANSDLHVTFDKSKKKLPTSSFRSFAEGITYTGTDASLNSYCLEDLFFKVEQKMPLEKRLSQLSELKYPDTKKILSVYKPVFDSLKTIQQEFIHEHPSPYSWILEHEHQLGFYAQICLSSKDYVMEDSLFNKIRDYKTYILSGNSRFFYQYLCDYIRHYPGPQIMVGWKEVAHFPDLTQVEQAAIDSLRATQNYARSHPRTLEWYKEVKPRILKVLSERELQRNIRLADSLLTPVKADIIKLLFNQDKDIEEQKIALQQIVPSMSTPWCRAIAKKEYAQTIARVDQVNQALAASDRSSATSDALGKVLEKTSFGATLYKVSGVRATDFLAKLKSSFAGKAIILDRWATWCGPCLEEMPHSKKLQQEAQDLPVVFIYACTASSSDEGKWKRKIFELELPGIHFFIDEALDAELAAYFSFTGYPGYAFIDQKGTYKPGAIEWISLIKDRSALEEILR